MKVPAKDFDDVRQGINAYARAHLGFGTRGMCDYWEAFAWVMDSKERVKPKSGWAHFYDVLGLTDSHIETALKRIASL